MAVALVLAAHSATASGPYTAVTALHASMSIHGSTGPWMLVIAGPYLSDGRRRAGGAREEDRQDSNFQFPCAAGAWHHPGAGQHTPACLAVRLPLLVFHAKGAPPVSKFASGCLPKPITPTGSWDSS